MPLSAQVLPRGCPNPDYYVFGDGTMSVRTSMMLESNGGSFIDYEPSGLFQITAPLARVHRYSSEVAGEEFMGR
jgi:hypothetical protein